MKANFGSGEEKERTFNVNYSLRVKLHRGTPPKKSSDLQEANDSLLSSNLKEALYKSL